MQGVTVEMTLSFETRKQTIETLTTEKMDLLIIGGGITGAGLALQAGAQNLKTGLIDMQDFAAGTSSRSTKLVHGGLRYLKQFEVELVADITKERAVVSSNAPHIVKPEWMLLPVYDEPGASFTDFSADVALDLYDRLADVDPKWHHSLISREEVLDNIPTLKENGLLKGGLYLDYFNDDARLTIEIMKKAADLGTLLANYVKATGFLYDEAGQIIGVTVEDVLTGEQYEIKANVVVNATGPWSDTIRGKQKSDDLERMYPTKGVHFVVDAADLPVKYTVYTDTGLEDDRMIFIIPRGDKTYFGTTDTPYDGDLTEPPITQEDIDYLLEAVNTRFPEAHLTVDNIESGWSGLRPLLLEKGATDPSSISRTHDVFVSEAGLVTIAGGKLTDYRLMAQDTFDQILMEFEQKTGSKHEKVETRDIALSGGELPAGTNFNVFVEDMIAKGSKVGLTEKQARQLAQWYGSNVETVFGLKEQADEMDLPLDIGLSLAYALTYEMVINPVDFFLRRTDILLFNTEKIAEWKQPVIDYMATHFKWTNQELEKWTKQLNDAITQTQLKKFR